METAALVISLVAFAVSLLTLMATLVNLRPGPSKRRLVVSRPLDLPADKNLYRVGPGVLVAKDPNLVPCGCDPNGPCYHDSLVEHEFCERMDDAQEDD